MNQKSMTPDERFLKKLYEMAQEKGDLFQEMDASLVAKAVSLRDTALKNIVKHLAQANFIKKQQDNYISLTQNGCRFIEEYL